MGCIKRDIGECQTSHLGFPLTVRLFVMFFFIWQEKGRSEVKTKRSGKQAKKAKVETESRNIREMFSRACRKS